MQDKLPKYFPDSHTFDKVFTIAKKKRHSNGYIQLVISRAIRKSDDRRSTYEELFHVYICKDILFLKSVFECELEGNLFR